MTPVDRTDDLRGPPPEIGLEDLAIVWTRLEDVPESASLSVVHDQIQMSGHLIRGQQMRRPWRVGQPCLEQKVAFRLRRALLSRPEGKSFLDRLADVDFIVQSTSYKFNLRENGAQ